MKILSLLLALGSLVLTPALVSAAVVLELKDQQVMAAGNITLNDLLQSSQGLSEDDLGVVLAPAPALGQAETWTREQIATLLPDSIKQQMPAWTGAKACAISRPAAMCNAAQVSQLIGAELVRELPADSKFQVIELAGFQPFLIPRGPIDARVELGKGALRNEWGDVSLQFNEEGRLAVTQNVRFHWACTRTVWQSANRVPSGQPLTASDFQQVETDILKIPGELQPASTFPEGKVAAHILMQGKILMENDWVEPTLVNRNDLVTVLYDRNGLSITLQARAMASGVKDQIVEVQNMSSHKIFTARVVDERTLEYAD